MNRILIGNEAVNLRLKGMLSHGYLIAGEEGSGRSVVVETLARKALCSQLTPENLPCGQCNACKKMNHHSHPDYHSYGWEKPLNAEQIRELKKQVHVRPNDGVRSVFVLYRADELLEGNQNILLKTLEEPPGFSVFLLVTGESGGVLETIQSRCQMLVLRPVGEMEAIRWLGQRYPSKTGLEEVAKRAKGFLGKAVLELEPERGEKINQEKEMNHPQAEEFHLGKTGRKKEVLKKAAVKPVENQKLLGIAERIVTGMVKQRELEVLEATIPLEKLDKESLITVLELISGRLSRILIEEKKQHIYQCLTFMEEVKQGVERNVGGAQVVGWIAAGTVQKGGSNGRNNNRSI